MSNPERATLAEIGKRLGRKALRAAACVAKPDTILAWYRRLVAKKFDGSKHRQYPGRPAVAPEVEALVVRMARENTGWGYDRIVGALTNLDGGMFVVLDDARHARQIVSASDLLETDRRERAGAKNRLHYLLQKTRATDLSSVCWKASRRSMGA